MRAIYILYTFKQSNGLNIKVQLTKLINKNLVLPMDLYDDLLDEIQTKLQKDLESQKMFNGVNIYGLPSDINQILNFQGNIDKIKSFLMLFSFFLGCAKIQAIFMNQFEEITHKTLDNQIPARIIIYEENIEHRGKGLKLIQGNVLDKDTKIKAKQIYSSQEMSLGIFIKQIRPFLGDSTLMSKYQNLPYAQKQRQIYQDVKKAIISEINQKLHSLKQQRQFIKEINEFLSKIPQIQQSKTYTELQKQFAQIKDEYDKDCLPLENLEKRQTLELQNHKQWKKLPQNIKQRILEYFQNKNIRILEDLRKKQNLDCNTWKQWLILQLLKYYEKKFQKNNRYFLEQGKKMQKKAKGQRIQIQKSPIISKYPKQIAKIIRINNILADHIDNKINHFKQAYNSLGIIYQKKLQHYFMFSQQKIKQPSQIQNDQKQKVSVEPLSSVMEYQSQQKKKEQNERSLQQILQNIQNYSNLQNIQPQLRQSISLIQQQFSKIMHWNSKSINQWANQTRKQKAFSLEKMIAVLDKANEISTQGHRLRHTQMLAILLYVKNYQSSGRIGQIKTGQGKTTIVAILSAIQIFYDYQVDVLTNNSVLAKEFIHEKEVFFRMLGISISHNTEQKEGFKECYNCDLVCGTITSFQFDYLRHIFEKENIMGTRNLKKNWVILDEVDSLIIDQGANIAKISKPFPGMESLRYVYINIWDSLRQTECQLQSEFSKQIGLYIEQKLVDQIDVYKQSFKENFQKQIIGRMIQKKSQNIQFKLIPPQIHSFVQNNYQKWIKNAYRAKYAFKKDQQYKLVKKQGDQQPKIVPIDHLNTGVTLNNTILSNGIHQFLQLKHNLFLTYQNLTSSFISNVSYIQKYENKIFGLTGTLGSKSEMDLLNYIYKVNFFSIPTFKQKRFIFHGGKIVKDSQFLSAVCYSSLRKTVKIMNQTVQSFRSVLIICETVVGTQVLKQHLQDLIKRIGLQKYVNIKLFTEEQHSEMTRQIVQPGDIIIATNISGRGTDYKISQSLNKNGGLHVIITFLPCNKRVQDQALGRTSRQGNNGSGQIIVNRNSIISESSDSEDIPFKEALYYRDKQQQKRLLDVKSTKYLQIKFKDQLFAKFCDLYAEIKKNNKGIKSIYLCNDIKQKWAFWIQSRYSSSMRLSELDPDIQFKAFQIQAAENIKGNIQFNIYNSICLIDKYIEQRNFKKADQEFQNASKFKQSQLCYPLYMKKFELDIEKGDQLTQRFKKGLSDIFYMNCQKNQNYKREALESLQKALKGIIYELEYYKSKILKIENGNQQVQNKIREIFCNQSDGENYLVKHLLGRYICLNAYHENIMGLKNQLKSKFKDGIIISSKVPKTIQKFDSQKYISKSEVNQFESIGIGSLVLQSQVHDVSGQLLNYSRLQILGGMAALGICIPFPYLSPTLCQIAGCMISQGISSIIFALLDIGKQQFNGWDYAKQKILSYAISIATFGIKKLFQSVEILRKAADICKKLAQRLREFKRFKSLCSWLATILENLAAKFQFMITKIKIQKAIINGCLVHEQLLQFKKKGGYKKFIELRTLMSDTYNMVNQSSLKLLSQTIKTTASNVFKSTCISQIRHLTLYQYTKIFKNDITEYVKKNVGKQFKSHIKIISHYPQKKLFEKIYEFDTNIQQKVLKPFIDQLTSNSSWEIQAIKLAAVKVLQGYQFYNFCQKKLQKYVSVIDDKIDWQQQLTPEKTLLQVQKALVTYISNLLISKIFKASSDFIQGGYRTLVKISQNNKNQQKLKKQINDIKRQDFIANFQQNFNYFAGVVNQMAKMFEVLPTQITNGTGISSLMGANGQGIKQIFQKIGLSSVYEYQGSNQNHLSDSMNDINCDRAIICLKENQSTMEHAQFIVRAQDGNLRIGSQGGKQLNQFIQQNQFNKQYKVYYAKGGNTKQLQNIKKKIGRNIIIRAHEQKLNFVGLYGGEKYGTYKTKINIQQINKPQQLMSKQNESCKKCLKSEIDNC